MTFFLWRIAPQDLCNVATKKKFRPLPRGFGALGVVIIINRVAQQRDHLLVYFKYRVRDLYLLALMTHLFIDLLKVLECNIFIY